MKKKTLIVSLLLTLALVFGSFTSVFAGVGPATDETKKQIEATKIRTITKIQGMGGTEVSAETFSINFLREVVKGKYKVINTSGVRKSVAKKDAVIVDTMPEGWYNGRHIPGAKCQVVGAMNSPEFKILKNEKKDLLKMVNKACGKKTYYYNTKTKKWQSKKIKGAKTKKMVNKDKKIIVYCGFVGCARSHQGAMYLVKQGFTNVYRYPGGIAAWVDGGNDIEGTDVK